MQFLGRRCAWPYNFRLGRFLDETIRAYRVVRGLFLLLIWSVYGFKPMRQKELFLRRQKCFRGSNDRTQRRRHLKTDQDKDDAPDSEMTFAPRTKEAGRRVDKA